MDPFRNRIFFQMVSHKLTRLAAPYFLLLGFTANVFLEGAFFQLTLILQVLFYLAALLRFTPLAATRAGGPIRVAWTFVVLNAAGGGGALGHCEGERRTVVWRKSQS